MKLVLGFCLLFVSVNVHALVQPELFVGTYKVAKCDLLPEETTVQIEKINNTLQILPMTNQSLPVLKIILSDLDSVQVQAGLFSIVNNLFQDVRLIATQKIARSATGNRVRYKLQQFIQNEEFATDCLFYRK